MKVEFYLTAESGQEFEELSQTFNTALMFQLRKFSDERSMFVLIFIPYSASSKNYRFDISVSLKNSFPKEFLVKNSVYITDLSIALSSNF